MVRSINLIRINILLLLTLSSIKSAELIVYTSAKAKENDWVSATVCYEDGSYIHNEPEQSIVQEGQIIREVYKNLKPGKYRIFIKPVGIIGYTEALKETHLTLKEDSSESIILIADEPKKINLPKELTDAFENLDGSIMWNLAVRYPGFKDEFDQVSTVSEANDYKKFIHYLRPDGEYTLTLCELQKEEKKVYEKKFRVNKEQPSDEKKANDSSSESQSK